MEIILNKFNYLQYVLNVKQIIAPVTFLGRIMNKKINFMIKEIRLFCDCRNLLFEFSIRNLYQVLTIVPACITKFHFNIQ